MSAITLTLTPVNFLANVVPTARIFFPLSLSSRAPATDKFVALRHRLSYVFERHPLRWRILIVADATVPRDSFLSRICRIAGRDSSSEPFPFRFSMGIELQEGEKLKKIGGESLQLSVTYL